jgi:hypothetical protein
LTKGFTLIADEEVGSLFKRHTDMDRIIKDKSRFEDTPAFNLFKDRDEMNDVEQYVAKLRNKML